jgi:hypothetical protein
MKNPRSFYVALAALGVKGASLAYQLSDRKEAAELLREQRILRDKKVEVATQAAAVANEKAEVATQAAALANAKAEVATQAAQLAERKADFALQQLNQPSKPELPKIDKSSVFDFMSDIFNSLGDFMFSLDLVHNAALFNILVITTICLGLVDIFVLYLSDFYISKLNLETRYPKLARYLQARQILLKGSLLLHTLCLGLVIIFGLLMNFAILIYG